MRFYLASRIHRGWGAMSFFGSSWRRLAAALLVWVLAASCGPSEKVGTVMGLVLAEGHTVAIVKLDDGSSVNAMAMAGPTRVPIGQKVKIQPTKNPNIWHIVSVVEAGK